MKKRASDGGVGRRILAFSSPFLGTDNQVDLAKSERFRAYRLASLDRGRLLPSRHSLIGWIDYPNRAGFLAPAQAA
jgi:hypothetical protein